MYICHRTQQEGRRKMTVTERSSSEAESKAVVLWCMCAPRTWCVQWQRWGNLHVSWQGWASPEHIFVYFFYFLKALQSCACFLLRRGVVFYCQRFYLSVLMMKFKKFLTVLAVCAWTSLLSGWSSIDLNCFFFDWHVNEWLRHSLLFLLLFA